MDTPVKFTITHWSRTNMGTPIKLHIHTLRPTQIGTPIIIAGTAMPAIRAMTTGAPTNMPSCHNTFFLRLQGFLPQNVQPDGLK